MKNTRVPLKRQSSPKKLAKGAMASRQFFVCFLFLVEVKTRSQSSHIYIRKRTKKATGHANNADNQNARLTATTAGGKRSCEVLFFRKKKKKSYFWKVYTGRTKKNRRINVNVQNTNGFRKDDDLSCRIGSFLNSGVRTKILTQANF